MAITRWMGFGTSQASGSQSTGSSAVDDTKSPVASTADHKQFGLENFGNTCYCNSVIQALYFCYPFRELVLQAPDKTNPLIPPLSPPTPYTPPTPSLPPARGKNVRKPSANETRSPSDGLNNQTSAAPTGPPIPPAPPTLFSALRSLFLHISQNTLDKGTVAPRAFVEKLKKENELFRSSMHQDAHEFLNYLLNKVAEDLEELSRDESHSMLGTEDLSASVTSSGPSTLAATSNSGTSMAHATLVHSLFEGILTSETRCLTCETVSSRDEAFLDLSIDIEQNSSVTACLRQFSASEMLCQKNKFFCDSCCGLQEAEKRMKIKRLPNVLALHLKRFKYQEDLQKYIKLTYRVAFPLELRLFNTVDDVQNPDRLYELFAIVVHIGNGPHHGHYIAVVKSRGSWVVFDDDAVDTIKESDIPKYFGDSNSGSAYVLYYQAVDLDLGSLGLRLPEPSVPDSAAEPERVPESPTSVMPLLPPGLTHEGDSSDSSEPVLATPASPNIPAIPSTSKSDALPIPVSIFPPESAPLSTPLPTSPTTAAKTSFFSSMRRDVSSRPSGANNRSSLYATLTGMPNLNFGSPKTSNEFGEASTSISPPASNGKVKTITKEKSTGWFQKRKSAKPEKSEKIPEANLLGARPATSHDTKDRSDDASILSSSTSSRAPLHDSSPQMQPSNTSLDSQPLRPEVALGLSGPNSSPNASHALHDRMSTSPSSMTDTMPSSPPMNHASSSYASSSSATHTHYSFNTFHSQTSHLASALHIPGHKKSQPALNNSSRSPVKSTEKPPRRPSTAGATLSSSPPPSFPSAEDSHPMPPLPTGFLSPRAQFDSPPLAYSPPEANGDILRRRNSVQTGSSSGASATKRPPRKMSFTGGMLGFGRKDKGKEKDSPSTAGTISPSTTSASVVPGMSVIGRL